MTERLDLDISFAGRIDAIDKRVKRLETLEFASVAVGGAGGLTEIETITIEVPASSFVFDDIPQTFLHLLLIISARSHSMTMQGPMRMIFNEDDTANYWYDKHWFGGDTGACAHTCIALFGAAEFANYIGIGDVPGLSFGGAGVWANLFNSQTLWIPDYRCHYKTKSCHWDNEYVMADGEEMNPAKFRQVGGGFWHDTDTIVEIEISAGGAATFAKNSKISLYGIGGEFECFA